MSTVNGGMLCLKTLEHSLHVSPCVHMFSLLDLSRANPCSKHLRERTIHPWDSRASKPYPSHWSVPSEQDPLGSEYCFYYITCESRLKIRDCTLGFLPDIELVEARPVVLIEADPRY